MIEQAALLFLLGLSIDLCYVWYLRAILDKKKWRAGALSVLLATPSMFGWFAVYENKVLAVPYLFGLFLGTVLAMELKGEK